MEKIQRYKIAHYLDASTGHISDIFNGKAAIGKPTAIKIGNLTGRRWVEYMDMDPETIRADIENAITAQENQACRKAS